MEITIGQTIISGYRCTECDNEFWEVPSWGYCDETMACTDPETIVPTTWVATKTDLSYYSRQQLLGGTSHYDYCYLLGGTSAQNYYYLLGGTSH